MMMRKSLSQLKHRIIIASSEFKVDQNGSPIITRTSEIEVWGSITEIRTSAWLRSGLNSETIYESHKIVCRNFREYDFTTAAWVFERRLKTSSRWYKVLGFSEQGEFMQFDVALRSRDNASFNAPVCDAAPLKVGAIALPAGVRL